MGKTMLLARIAAELRTTPELSARFIPLVFAEEQYAVDRLSKFWLNCLDSLADARELAKDTRSVHEIDDTVSKLTAAGMGAAKDDQPFADEVFGAFTKIAQAGGQRPVLLVDSLQLVFERLDSGQLSITPQGVERVIEQDILLLRRNRLLVERNPEADSGSSNGDFHRLSSGFRILPPDSH